MVTACWTVKDLRNERSGLTLLPVLDRPLNFLRDDGLATLPPTGVTSPAWFGLPWSVSPLRCDVPSSRRRGESGGDVPRSRRRGESGGGV